MTRLDSMLDKKFHSDKKLTRPPVIKLKPARTLVFAFVVVPAAAAFGLLVGEAMKWLR